MPHTAEPPVGGVDASANNAKPAIGDLFAEQIVFRIKRAFMEATQAVKCSFFEKHEHASAKWADQDRAILCDIVSEVQNVVAYGPLAAPDVGGNAVELPSRDQVHGAAQ